MRVLHVNVRLLEGGAAGVTRDLHLALIRAGIDSRFAYGWGERGGPSSIEKFIPNSFQVGAQVQVATNIVSHRIFGIDVLKPFGESEKRLAEAIKWSDVIHLHVIHSYFAPYKWFFDLIFNERKPIVWTAHDYWMLTGRCAFTEGCRNWLEGCGKCPTQKNYPPSHMDFSGHEFQAKRRIINRLGTKLHFVAPTSFVAEELKIGYPNLTVDVIPNWLDEEFNTALNMSPLSKSTLCIAHTEQIKVLVVANDLSDHGKVDPSVITQLQKIPYIEIHTVGSNSPFIASNVINHGKIVQRIKMVEVMKASDVALFTSEKDTFGLVMIEALACGTPVLAVNSLAAKEVLEAVGITPVTDKSAIVDYLATRTLPDCYKSFETHSLQKKVVSIYDQAFAISRYIEIYKKLCG